MKLSNYCLWRKIWYVLAFCVLLGGELRAQESVIYAVQLGVFKNPKKAQDPEIKAIGTIHTEAVGENTRVLLGKFKNRPDAERALMKVLQAGFSEAFIVTRPTEVAPDKATSNNIPPPSKPNAATTPPDQVFLVQIGAYSQAIPPSDLAKAVAFGSVYAEKAGQLTKVYVGTFASADASGQALTAIRASGLTHAFRREMPYKNFTQLNLLKAGKANNPDNKDKETLHKIAGTPIAFTDKTAFVQDIAMFDNGTKNDTIAIDGRILPISAKECLFIGTLDPYNSDAYQPLVLHTSDGGKTWAETLQSEYGNSINSIQFVGKKTIFLTTMWVIEGPGEVNLFRSDDAGKTWNKVSKIPRNDFLCVSSYLHFTDANKGKIIYTCSDDGYSVWETTDGGAKWKSKGKVAAKDFKKLKSNSLLDYTPQSSYTAIADASIYKQVSTPDVHIIQLRNAKTKKYAEVSRLTRWYKMTADYQIIPY
jgi:cell division septation protein DedD